MTPSPQNMHTHLSPIYHINQYLGFIIIKLFQHETLEMKPNKKRKRHFPCNILSHIFKPHSCQNQTANMVNRGETRMHTLWAWTSLQRHHPFETTRRQNKHRHTSKICISLHLSSAHAHSKSTHPRQRKLRVWSGIKPNATPQGECLSAPGRMAIPWQSNSVSLGRKDKRSCGPATSWTRRQTENAPLHPGARPLQKQAPYGKKQKKKKINHGEDNIFCVCSGN